FIASYLSNIVYYIQPISEHYDHERHVEKKVYWELTVSKGESMTFMSGNMAAEMQIYSTQKQSQVDTRECLDYPGIDESLPSSTMNTSR
ncbi:hypothetical protein STEG23_034579, partial [Scotinomys teguina]